MFSKSREKGKAKKTNTLSPKWKAKDSEGLSLCIICSYIFWVYWEWENIYMCEAIPILKTLILQTWRISLPDSFNSVEHPGESHHQLRFLNHAKK